LSLCLIYYALRHDDLRASGLIENTFFEIGNIFESKNSAVVLDCRFNGSGYHAYRQNMTQVFKRHSMFCSVCCKEQETETNLQQSYILSYIIKLDIALVVSPIAQTPEVLRE
jgi:hypothetical protein